MNTITISYEQYIKYISSTIQKARKDSGLTQTELANKLGINHAQISLWETGKRVPNMFSFGMIAGALEMSFGELYEYASKAETPLADSTNSRTVKIDSLNTHVLPRLSEKGIDELTTVGMNLIQRGGKYINRKE